MKVVTWSLIVIGLFIVIAYISFTGIKEPAYDTFTVERQDLVQEISSTGRVVAVRNVDLAFEQSGRVSNIYVQVGDRVKIGQALISLDGSDIVAQLSQSEARLSKDLARLLELKNGVRSEEIVLQEIKVKNDEVALDDAKKSLINALQDAYTKSDDAVRSKIDQLFDNPRASSPQLTFILVNSQLENDIERERIDVESVLIQWASSLLGLTTSSFLEDRVIEAQQHLAKIKTLAEKVGLAVNSSIVSGATQSTIDAWKLDISTARTNLNIAISNITASKEKMGGAKSSLAISNQELALKKSGTIGQQILAQEAQTRESEANVQYYRALVAKLTLRSPISGLVTAQNTKVGAIAPANSTIVSVISDGEYQIETLIVEADIANLEVGNLATLSLDAYGEDVSFEAEVIKVDPAAELIEGVANYKTTLKFKKEDTRIRSGMTADIDIITEQKENVIAIPQRSVIYKNGLKIVRILQEDGTVKEVEVELGITGNRGLVEILRGVNDGEIVVTATRT